MLKSSSASEGDSEGPESLELLSRRKGRDFDFDFGFDFDFARWFGSG